MKVNNLLFILMLFLLGSTVHAQTHGVDRITNRIMLSGDSVLKVSNNTILSTSIALQNYTEEDITGHLRFDLPDGATLLNTNTRVHIPAGGKMYFPARIRIGNILSAGMHSLISHFEDHTGTIIASTTTELLSEKARSVLLNSMTREVIMTREGDSALIQLWLRNTGNTAEKIRLVSSLPSSKSGQGREFHITELTVVPAQDTLVEINHFIDRYRYSLDFFYINITGLYADDELFGNHRIGVQRITSTRSFSNPDLYQHNWSSTHNRIELSVRNPFTDQLSWQLFGNGSYRLQHGSDLDFNVNAYQWTGDDKPVLNNTYVRYDYQNKGITVGNINESLERYISGRGSKIHYGDSAGNYLFQVGFADKQYNLLQSRSGALYNDGYTVFSSFRQQYGPENRNGILANILYDRDSYENTESFLYNNQLDLVFPTGGTSTRLGLIVGGGLSRPLVLAEGLSSNYQPSGAAGLTISTMLDKFIVSSNNFYSSAYYPGNRRGILQSNHRISRSFGNNHIWTAINYYESSPQSFNRVNHAYDVYFLYSKAEIGLSTSFGPFIQMTWAPRYDFEKGRYNFLGQEAALSSYSNFRLSQLLNWRSRNNKHQANLSIELGVENTTDRSFQEIFQHKSTLTYHRGSFGMTAYFQQGAFSLAEKLSNELYDRDSPFRFGASAYFSKGWWQNQLQTNLSLNYYSDHLSGQNTAINGRIQYFINRKSSVYINTQAYHYNSIYYTGMPNMSFQAGIVQKLPENKGSKQTKTGSITLFAYHDNNHNNRYDKGDTPAINKILMLDGIIFITDDKGEIHYKNVPYGTHTITAPIEAGWHADQNHFLLERRSETIHVPLKKSGTVRGKLVYKYDPRLSIDINTSLEGFQITAVDAQGHTVSTRTDSEGNFLLFLAEGIHDIILNENALPEGVHSLNTSSRTEVVAGEVNRIPNFELGVQERKIEIKRFQSNP